MKVFIDTETTGLDPAHHSILSVAIGNKEIGYKEFHFRPNEDLIIDPKAMEVNNIDLNGLWADDTYRFKSHLEKLKLEYEELEPVGHNYQFDMGFLYQVIGKKGYSRYFSRRYVDTMIVAKFIDDSLRECVDRFPLHPFGYSLTALCKVYGYENELGHTAEADARATESIYYSLMQYIKM